MARLDAEFTPGFERDCKRLAKAHRSMTLLHETMELVLENTERSTSGLRRRRNMHVLSGKWRGSWKRHVCNAGDWLLIWRTGAGMAVFERTGSHDDLFR